MKHFPHFFISILNSVSFHGDGTETNDVVPMDVDVVRGTTTEQEKELYCHKGLCFECQGTGHTACYCPKKKQKQ